MRGLIVCFLLFFTVQSFAKNPVILISIDGFAFDYLKKHQPEHLLSLANRGTYAKGMQPVFPSKTFPNHLSIVTGVYPAKHGIIHNKFYHRELKQRYTLGAGKNNNRWLTAKPIWTVAEQSGLKSAIYFWPESETTVDGTLPSYYYPYKHNTPNVDRVDQIVSWLKLPEQKRPNFIASYFSVVDSAGHYHGLESNELRQTIKEVDQLIGRLIKRISSETEVTPNYVIVSDHGMTKAGKSNALNWNELLSPYKNLHVVGGQTQLYIYENDQNKLNKVITHLKQSPYKKRFQIFTRNNYPKHWHFVKNDKVIPDMVINALPPTTFEDDLSHANEATHGFDPKGNPDLLALFITAGPNIKQNHVIDTFDNIHIFPFLENLLALPESTDIDGNKAVLSTIVID